MLEFIPYVAANLNYYSEVSAYMDEVERFKKDARAHITKLEGRIKLLEAGHANLMEQLRMAQLRSETPSSPVV